MVAEHILIIEDDDIVARTIERCLRRHEYHVTRAASGIEGLQIARRIAPDMVILDVIMPGMDGFAVCREMRADPLLSGVPVLFLTAKSKDEDKISGFIAGADDYLSKPFNLEELILRVRAIIRRSNQRPVPGPEQAISPEEQHSAQQPTLASSAGQNGRNRVSGEPRFIEIRGYILDTRSFQLITPLKQKIRLTPVQYDLVYHLMSHPGEIFSPPRLLDEVWDYPSDAGSPDLVRVHIKNLRERIEPDPKAPAFIETVPGYGYTIRPEEDL